MIVHIKKNYNVKLCYFLLCFTLFIGFFLFNFEMSQSFLYFGDFILLILLTVNIKAFYRTIISKELLLTTLIIILLFLWGIFLCLLNGISIYRVFWSIRNWGRFFIFFFLCVSVLKKQYIKNILKFTKIIFNFNVLIVIIQYVFFNDIYSRDEMNGIFGRNTSSVFLTITLIFLALTTAQFISNNIKLTSYIIDIIKVLIVSILAELRVIPVTLLLMICCAYLFSGSFTIKKLLKLIFLIGILFCGISLFSSALRYFYPDTSMKYDFYSIIQAASTKGGYGYSGGVDRLTFIPVINNLVYNSDKIRFSGIGLGNAEYSIYSILCSPFYNYYGESLRYLNFSSSMIYIETGLIGLVLYSSFFISILIVFVNKFKSWSWNRKKKNKLFFSFGIEMVLVNLIYIFYNNLHRSDIAYILAFYLAIAYIGCTKEE